MTFAAPDSANYSTEDIEAQKSQRLQPTAKRVENVLRGELVPTFGQDADDQLVTRDVNFVEKGAHFHLPASLSQPLLSKFSASKPDKRAADLFFDGAGNILAVQEVSDETADVITFDPER